MVFGASRRVSAAVLATTAIVPLHNVKIWPAKVGDKLTTRFFQSGTRGFCTPEDANVAVCLMPGTELSFTDDVRRDRMWPWRILARRGGWMDFFVDLTEDGSPVFDRTLGYVLPRLAMAFAFKQRLPELTISYEDAAEVILDNL